ncbi:MAG TPA: hypothetical protein VJ438_00170 [Candidatus Nanoarchaeia archaeon]|nr:hypothetical protein [Candidatus Nanoarchaeia archaeon]
MSKKNGVAIIATVPSIISNNLNDYLKKKNEEVVETGGFKKISKQDLICHALKEMLDNDTYKI